MTLAALPFAANFLHPLMMWALLAGGGYALYLGVQAKKFAPARRRNAKP
jgi:hypothetical protein